MWRIVEYLLSLVAQKFWGEVLITFKEGRILHVRTVAQATEECLPRFNAKNRSLLTPDDRALLAMMETPHEVMTKVAGAGA